MDVGEGTFKVKAWPWLVWLSGPKGHQFYSQPECMPGLCAGTQLQGDLGEATD